MEVDGIRLHYIEKGRGRPVVLLHGNGAMVEDFVTSGVIDRMAETHRVIALDRPGFGYSARPRDRLWTANAQADLLRKALARLGADRPILVGHSWGTLVAVAFALRHPNEVRGLVLMSGYYFPTARLDVPLLSPPAIPVLGDVIRYTLSPVLGRLMMSRIVARLFAPRPVPRRFAAGFPTGLTLRPWQIRASAEETAFMIPMTLAFRRRYRSLTMPVMVIVGTDDRLIGAEAQSERLYRILPHAELLTVPHAGHMVHHAIPDRVADAVGRVAEAADAPDLRDARDEGAGLVRTRHNPPDDAERRQPHPFVHGR